LNQQNEYLKEKVEILQNLGNEKVLECIKQQKKILSYEQELEILRTTVSKLSNNYLVQENAEIRDLLELYQTQQTEKDKELLHREEEIKKYILKMQETLTSREKEMNKLKEEIQREQKKIQIYFQTKEELHQEKLQELEDLKYDFLLQKNLFEEEKKNFEEKKNEDSRKKISKKISATKIVSESVPSSPIMKTVPTMTPITLNGDGSSEFEGSKSDTTTTETPPPLSPKRKISSTSMHFAALRDLYENKSRGNSPRSQQTDSPRRKTSFKQEKEINFVSETTSKKKKSLELNLKNVDLNITDTNLIPKTPRVVPTNTSSLLQKFYKGIKDETLDLSKTKLSSIEIHQLCVALQDNTSVKYLNLESTGITNKHLNHVATMLSKNKSIVELNLSGNEISNWNLISNALLKNQTICKIDFGNVNEKDVQMVELIQEKLMSKE
jgi:hypothetical protein